MHVHRAYSLHGNSELRSYALSCQVAKVAATLFADIAYITVETRHIHSMHADWVKYIGGWGCLWLRFVYACGHACGMLLLRHSLERQQHRACILNNNNLLT
jgi:hypothetical protein